MFKRENLDKYHNNKEIKDEKLQPFFAKWKVGREVVTGDRVKREQGASNMQSGLTDPPTEPHSWTLKHLGVRLWLERVHRQGVHRIQSQLSLSTRSHSLLPIHGNTHTCRIPEVKHLLPKLKKKTKSVSFSRENEPLL